MNYKGSLRNESTNDRSLEWFEANEVHFVIESMLSEYKS